MVSISHFYIFNMEKLWYNICEKSQCKDCAEMHSFCAEIFLLCENILLSLKIKRNEGNTNDKGRRDGQNAPVRKSVQDLCRQDL
mgnify:CR=1 FL=1